MSAIRHLSRQFVVHLDFRERVRPTSMALSDVFSFGVNSIFQSSSTTQPLLYGEVDVLFDIPLIGLFKAVRFESYPFYEAILL